MRDALISNFNTADICIMAAAVSDFQVENYSKTKIQKNEKNNFILELKPNPDILAELGKKKKNQFLVGFALENSNSEDRACSKMEKKGCDMMIYNNFDSSIGLTTTRISILARNGFNQKIPVMNKSEVAGIIFKKIIELSDFFHG
jgi:phosphopantothenoylcysteine decarboxylase/phosphopantothenate--cysteine ligase